jgi:hypothetical protein
MRKETENRAMITFRNSEANSISFHNTKGLSNILRRTADTFATKLNECMIAKYLIIPSSLFQVNISINY